MASASHVAHQVGVSDDQPEAALERQPSLPKTSKVSFDQPEATSIERKDSYSGNTRVSFEQPADLFVTSALPQDTTTPKKEETEPKVEVAEPVVKADASNTGTARRKSKKKRDEVGCWSLHVFLDHYA